MAVVFAVLPLCRRPDPFSSSSTQQCVDTTRPDIVHLNNQNDPVETSKRIHFAWVETEPRPAGFGISPQMPPLNSRDWPHPPLASDSRPLDEPNPRQ
jgi:hypothetical protein